jgi:hypothetical protein
MCYIVYQESGDLADQAKKYSEIRLSQGIPSAIEYFRKVTGMQGAIEDSIWWIYNADQVIKQNYPVTYVEAESWIKSRGLKENDQNYAIAVCSIATRKTGGIWKFYYEY